jgi:hypothetical protein
MMLAYRHSSRPIHSLLFQVACAILALLLDTIPAPMAGLAPSARVASGGATPSIPLPDDSEGDETPDDANVLACSTRTRVALARPSDRSTRDAVTVRPGAARARSRPDVPPLAIDLPIALCRLTC